MKVLIENSTSPTGTITTALSKVNLRELKLRRNKGEPKMSKVK